MKQPFVWVAIAYAGGLLLGRWVSPPLTGLFVVCFALAVVALAWERARRWLLWPLLVFMGWTALTTRTAILSPVDLRLLFGDQAALADVRGRLDGTPSPRVRVRGEDEEWHTLAIVRVDKVRRRENWEPAFGEVAVTTPGVLPAAYFDGQAVEITGVIAPPNRALAEGLFNYRAYLGWQGVYHLLRVKTTNDWRLGPEGSALARPPWADRFLTWAQALLAGGLPMEDEPLRLLWGMTLGWKTALTDEVSEPFMRTGTMHIFAISGLHIALIAGILVALLRVLQTPRGLCGWVVVPLIWFYTAATGWQPSAIRSTIMMTIVIAGWALRRPGDLVNSLAASAFLILVWEPRQLFQASFQLSFFVVLSIALLMPPLEKLTDHLLEPDPFLPAQLVPRWRRWLAEPLRGLSLSFATSLAAGLGSLPIIAWYFHLVTPVSLLANMVIVPLSGLALMSNLGGLACGPWSSTLTGLFNHAAWFWMAFMVRFSEWATTLPGAYFNVRPPGPVTFLIYYALLLGLFSGWLLEPRRRRWTFGLTGALVVALGVNWFVARNESRITVLALHGGAAQFIDSPGRQSPMLVDCGSESDAGFAVKPFLAAQGVNRLPCLLLTHGDVRHVGGTALITNNFNVTRIATSPLPSRSPAHRQIIATLERTPARWLRLQRGDKLGDWTVLHPSATNRLSQADDNSVVLLGEPCGVRVLLLGDLGKAGQSALLDPHADLRADVAVACMPTRGEPLGDGLLDAIQPRAIIVNDATYPANEMAREPLRERLARRAVPVIYTSDAGTATLRLRPGRWDIRTMDGQTVAGEASSAATREP